MIFDHIVVKVRRLDEAIRQFESAGFTVMPGGVHYRGISENALIFLEDGTFIELLHIRNSLSGVAAKMLVKIGITHFFHHSKPFGLAKRFYSRAIAAQEGITDYCLLLHDYEQTLVELEASPTPLSASITAGRIKPDGSRLEWQMSAPFHDDLPFFRSGYQLQKTVPTSTVLHKNGIKQIAVFHQIVSNFHQSCKYFTEWFQLLEILPEKGFARFSMGKTELRIYDRENVPSFMVQAKKHGSGRFSLEFDNGFAQEINLCGLSILAKHK